MTQKQLFLYTAVLEAKREDLDALLRNRDTIAINSNADMFDQIQQASERDLAIGTLVRESARLREVRAALGRIHSGTFGICLDCEEEISPQRLSALPWASSCIACREAADGNHLLTQGAFEIQVDNAA